MRPPAAGRCGEFRPKGLSSRPAKGTTGSLVEAGDDGGGRRQLAATLGRIYPYMAAKQQAPGVAAADGEEIPGQAGDDEQVGNDEIPGQAGDDAGTKCEDYLG